MAGCKKQDAGIEKTKLTVGEKFKKYSEIIKVILATLISMYPIANYVYEFIYQMNCEKFYGIPGRYFSTNINRQLLYLAAIIVLIIILYLPLFLKNHHKKIGNEKMNSNLYYIVLSILVGLELTVINLQNLIKIMQVTNNKNIFFSYFNSWIDKHALLVLSIVVIMSITSLVSIVVISDIKRKWIKKIVTWISIISLISSGMLIFYGVVLNLRTTIEDKTKYEIVTNLEKKYVVLTEEIDKIMVVEYSIEEGMYVFDTSQYLFLNRSDCKFSYINTEVTPIIYNSETKNN